MFSPPCSRAPNLRCGTRRDLDAERHRLSREIAEQIFNGNVLAALDFRNGGKQFVLVFGAELEGFIRTTCEDGYDRSFGQGNALDFDPAVYDGAGSDLHKPMVLGWRRTANSPHAEA